MVDPSENNKRDSGRGGRGSIWPVYQQAEGLCRPQSESDGSPRRAEQHNAKWLQAHTSAPTEAYVVAPH